MSYYPATHGARRAANLTLSYGGFATNPARLPMKSTTPAPSPYGCDCNNLAPQAVGIPPSPEPPACCGPGYRLPQYGPYPSSFLPVTLQPASQHLCSDPAAGSDPGPDGRQWDVVSPAPPRALVLTDAGTRNHGPYRIPTLLRCRLGAAVGRICTCNWDMWGAGRAADYVLESPNRGLVNPGMANDEGNGWTSAAHDQLATGSDSHIAR